MAEEATKAKLGHPRSSMDSDLFYASCLCLLDVLSFHFGANRGIDLRYLERNCPF
jgi:hypothetical protein